MSRVAGAIGLVASCCVACLACASCSAPRPPLSVGSEDTDVNVLAMKRAAREKDRSAVPRLVGQLESDDPAVRFYAIQALEELTGQTLGYRFYEDDEGRKAAVEKWKKWLEEQGK